MKNNAILQKISATVPDWSRENTQRWKWEPSKFYLKSIRQYQHCCSKKSKIFFMLAKIFVLKHRFWSVVTGADIPLNSNIAGGLLIPHPNGIVINPKAEIGPNCLIFQQVTIGTRGEEGLPKIGGHVDIGAGAKILGNVVVGDHAKIGANSVVVTDVPPGATAIGVPAQIMDE